MKETLETIRREALSALEQTKAALVDFVRDDGNS